NEKLTASLQGLSDTLTTVAKDNAWWDEAFEKLYLAYDPEWAHQTFGVDSITGTNGDIDVMAIADPAGKLVAGYGAPRPDQIFLDAIPDLKARIDKAV